MKASFFACVVAPCLLGLVADLAAESARPAPHVIAHSELRVLPPNAAGRHYQLHIGLPSNYAEEPEKRYPVVYVTDAYWDFGKISAIQGSLVYDKVAPEFITVGLGYAGEGLDHAAMRLWELAPVPMVGFAADPSATGHAAAFLASLENEIIPFVEREYRADPRQRVLAGASLGGLFTLYTLYTKPEFFQGYVAATPSVFLGDDWILGYEESFVRSGRPLRGRLFVAVGGDESARYVGAVLRYNYRVQSRRHPELAYAFRLIDGERHAGVQFDAYVRGLQFVFAPVAPETGASDFP